MSENKKYLTIHGHFYQPPRENPWIEEIEVQDSAKPNHDWNEKISWQCYGPNGASRIVDCNNSIIDISNNYEFMSYNFGPTLLSWMEKHDFKSYKRIIQADINSRKHYNGHGNAIAQVYNHIILPLANRNDKITQVIWGLKDFEKRFKRNSEGIWLAETAVDAQTLEVLIDCGVKFTILSPHQAKCINLIGENNWQDVSWGTIDPSQPYRYFVEGSDKEKYIDIFFYDGSISKSVAFDNLLQDGKKFAYRLNDGFVESRDHNQLVNIATDGESYGHHTKFGDMALAYVLKVGASELGFTITNYAQFLEENPPKYEVDIKPVSAWSCSHGVGRWMDDCGCSTGAQPHWNQKWRKPLRQALDYLRDELIKVCSSHGTKYYEDFWEARNNYIDVILDRSDESIDKFFKENCKKNLSHPDKVKALKLMEMQRFCQLMYTSCGWFFADISGIETTQILKYASRAMELAQEFSKTNFEKTFLSILQKAKSNIVEFGNGKDIYNRWVKPCSVGFYEIAAQYSIETSFNLEDKEAQNKLYCYLINKNTKKTYENLNTILTFGKIELQSDITKEKKDLSYVMLQTQNLDFYCAVKDFECNEDFTTEKKEILKVFEKGNTLDILQAVELYYGSKFYTLKDVPIDRRKTILEILINQKLQKASQTYEDLYESLLTPISYLNDLGMDIPESFRVCAKYTLISNTVEELSKMKTYDDKDCLERLTKIKELSDKFYIKLSNSKAKDILSSKLIDLLFELDKNPNQNSTKELLNFFNLIEKLEIETHIQTAQNIFWDIFCNNFDKFIERTKKDKNQRALLLDVLLIGQKLKINVNFYRDKVDLLTGKV